MNKNNIDIAANTFLAKWSPNVRWAAMIPFAVLGGVVISGLFKLFGVGDRTGSIATLGEICQAALFSILFVIIAAGTAPKYQPTVAIVSSSILCILYGVMMGVALIAQSGVIVSVPIYFLTLFSGIVGAIGAAIAVYKTVEDGK